MLAGGQSSRMGRDKARLEIGNVTLLEHALATLRRAGFTAAVAGFRGAGPCSAPVVADALPERGPLGGIEAALRSLQSAQQLALFVPIDLPLLPPEFLDVLWSRAQATEAWATVPFSGGRPHPLCAVYNTRLAGGIAAALHRGDRKVMRVLGELAPPDRFASFRVEALAPLYGWGDAHRWFTNLNTPADLAALQAGRSCSAAQSI